MPVPPASWVDLTRGAVLLRHARDAAHQCLYYLYHVSDTGDVAMNDELREDRQHAFERAADLVNGIHLPDAFTLNARAERHPLVVPAPAADQRRDLRQGAVMMRDLMIERGQGPAAPDAPPPAPNAEELNSVIAYWAEYVWGPINLRMGTLTDERGAKLLAPVAHSIAAAETDDLIARLQTFLARSRPWRGRTTLDRARTTLRRIVVRNAALLVGLTAVALVYAKVEAVHNLVFNMGLPAAVPPVLVFVFGPLVMTLLGLRARLNPGKGAFWRLAFPALAPVVDPQIVGPHRKLGTLIGKAEARKLAVLIASLVVSGTLLRLVIAAGNLERTHTTLFLLDSLCLLTLVFLHWLDHWDFLDHRPIRLYALSLSIVPLIVSLSGWWGDAQAWLTAVPALFGMWAFLTSFSSTRHRWEAATGPKFEQLAVWVAARFGLDTRSAVMEPDKNLGNGGFAWARAIGGGMAMMMAVGLGIGGRTRSQAIWGDQRHNPPPLAEGTAVPAIPVGEWPAGGDKGPPVVVIAASGGGSRAALYTAYFLERLHRERPEVANNIQAISSVSGGSLATAAYVALRRKALKDPQAAPFWLAGGDPDGAEKNDPDCQAVGCFHDGALVRAVGQDYLLATLKGALIPLRTRGQAIETAFREDGGLGDLRLEYLVQDWKDHGPFPIPLLNSCTLDDRAVVLSPLDREYYLPPIPRAANATSHDPRFQKLLDWYRLDDAKDLTWVLDRDEVLAFSDLNPRYSPSLAEAVRASANFPFGFPLVEVRTADNIASPYRKEGRVAKLTDGGVLSNSGMWTLYHLLTREPKVVKRLKERGVLLLVIDASHMPEYADDRRDLLSLYSAIGDQAPIAQNLHRRMFELLKKEYGSQLSILQLDIPPTVADNVLTTWALDNESKHKLRRSFCRMWRKGKEGSLNASERIQKHWNHLAKGEPLPENEAYAVLRPPLD